MGGRGEGRAGSRRGGRKTSCHKVGRRGGRRGRKRSLPPLPLPYLKSGGGRSFASSSPPPPPLPHHQTRRVPVWGEIYQTAKCPCALPCNFIEKPRCHSERPLANVLSLRGSFRPRSVGGRRGGSGLDFNCALNSRARRKAVWWGRLLLLLLSPQYVGLASMCAPAEGGHCVRTQFKGRRGREGGRASSVSVNPLDTFQGEAVLPGVFCWKKFRPGLPLLGE